MVDRMGRMPSPMVHRFSEVPRAEIPRASFDRPHKHLTTFQAGYLIPVFVDEALPGDTFNVRMSAFARLATPLHPIMDNMRISSFFFAVPNRLVWDNWEKFNGAQDNPGDSTDYLVPQTTQTVLEGELSDYLGVPVGVPLTFNSLHHRACNLIWNEWFRDQNLQDSLTVPKGDGPDDPSLFKVMRRGKRHDYFTSALPWPQKGPAVSLPLGTQAPLSGIGTWTSASGVPTDRAGWETGATSSRTFSNALGAYENVPGLNLIYETDGSANAVPLMYADLSQATAATINQLREAFQIQKLYERDARGGTRYTEIILSHFGVSSPDMRLQRPEYLGGGVSPVQVVPVAQTSSTDATTPQGNLAAVGTVGFTGHGFTKSFTEHCLLIGFVSVQADLTYQQGLNRMFSRQTRWDYYWPALSHIGEQSILNKEIYADGSANDDLTFGYQERYAEYRYKPSLVTGQMRSQSVQSLDTWHLAQDFASLPVLNNVFIEDNPPIDRVIAVPSEPHFLLDAFFNVRCARPMPVYGVPGLIDHF